MNNIISYLKVFGLFLIYILVLNFLISFINFITPISLKILQIISMIFMIILYFIIGFLMGNKSNKKGWLTGLLTGSIFICFLFIFSLIICFDHIKLATIPYYSVLLLCCIFGSIIGINKKKEE